MTVYSYDDATDATLTTQIKYPDGDTADNNVKLVYGLDGAVEKRTAQKPSGGAANVIALGSGDAIQNS